MVDGLGRAKERNGMVFNESCNSNRSSIAVLHNSVSGKGARTARSNRCSWPVNIRHIRVKLKYRRMSMTLAMAKKKAEFALKIGI